MEGAKLKGARLTYRGAQRRFRRRSKRKRRQDLRKTAKLTTRLRYKSPRAMMIRQIWIRDPGAADIRGIDTRRKGMGRRRSRSRSL